MININKIYDFHLRYLNELNRKERYEGEEHWFHASRAGNCYKKSIFDVMDFKQEPANDRSMRLFALGNLIHGDVQKALEFAINEKKVLEKHNTVVLNEYRMTIPELNVRGHADIIIINSPLTGGQYVTEILDIKTMASYSWSKKFGRNPEINPSFFANMQLATYQLALMKLRDNNEKLLINNKYYSINDNIIARLYYYKKDDSTTKLLLSEKRFIDRAIIYWEELNALKENIVDKREDGTFYIKNKDLVRVGGYGMPFQEWECNYCPYTKFCIGNLSTKRKKR